jgi:hypothetical protein
MDQTKSLVCFPRDNDQQKVLSELTPEEIDRQLITFSPGLRPTRMNLIANPKFIKAASRVCAYLECIHVKRNTYDVFELPFVTKQCNVLLSELTDDDDYSIDKWYRHHSPPMKENPLEPNNWSVKKMENKVLSVNWYEKIISEECQYPGFVKTLLHCILLNQTTKEWVKKEKEDIYGNFQPATGRNF